MTDLPRYSIGRIVRCAATAVFVGQAAYFGLDGRYLSSAYFVGASMFWLLYYRPWRDIQ